jgi:4-hydroxy-tetrahydrodipicolinate synthase
MAISPHFGHVVTAMVTPFDENLTIDEQAVCALVEHLIASGSSAVVVAGTTGESATLAAHEKVRLFQLVKDAVSGRIKVIAGTGTNNTSESIFLSKEAESIGVDGLLLVTPYYNKPSQTGLYAHYKAISCSTGLPVLLYNVPGRTSVNLSAKTCLQLANDCDNVVGVKEASKDLEQIGEIIANAPAGFQVYSGDDGTTLPILALGGVGVVSVTSHIFGKELAKMHEYWFEGNIINAREIHLKSLALTKTLFVPTNPVPVKHALKAMGVIPNDFVRLPLVQATTDESAAIKTGLKQYGLL